MMKPALVFTYIYCYKEHTYKLNNTFSINMALNKIKLIHY